MGVPKKIDSAKHWRVLSETVFSNNLLPDEDGDAYLNLEHELAVEFDARTAMEHLVVKDIFHLEWEKRRLRRWIYTILRNKVSGYMATALRQACPQGFGCGEPVGTLVQEWLNTTLSDRSDAEARIRSAGVDPTAIVADAYAACQHEIRQFEADLKSMDTRRRRLLDDLRRLQARRRPEASDAEIVEA
jgi:hypothetical protein